MRALLLALTIAVTLMLLAVGGGCVNRVDTDQTAEPSQRESSGEPAQEEATDSPRTADDEDASTELYDGPLIRAPHFVDSSPKHQQVLAAVPLNVVVNTNFDLVENSTINVTVDGQEVTTGESSVDESALALRRTLDQEAPDGQYKVEFHLCWPDRSCHDGETGFTVDRNRAASYEDQTGKSEVEIEMDDIQFNPARVKVSPGTKITWTNKESATHFVNTDPHPSHTFHPPMNSRGIERDETYSVTLTEPGEYPYHCSAHYDKGMVASIIVE